MTISNERYEEFIEIVAHYTILKNIITDLDVNISQNDIMELKEMVRIFNEQDRIRREKRK